MKYLTAIAGAVLFSLVASVSQAASAEIKFVNECSFWIRVFVDNVDSGSIPPGDEQKTTAAEGQHDLKAEEVTTNPNPRTVTQSITLKRDGFVWTLYEEKEEEEKTLQSK